MKKNIMSGIGIALLALAAFLPSGAKAQSLSDLQAIIAGLQIQINQLKSSLANATFTSDLSFGSTGSQVVALQNWLISRGYSIPAGATGYFGPQTQAAVARYQSASGIVPAIGYFGPITRARVNATITTAPPVNNPSNPGSNAKDEGQLRNYDSIGSVSNENLNECESDVEVLGVEMEAEDSDMTIERVDVDFELTSGTASDKLDDYITDVSIWLGSTKLAELDVDDADEDDDVYSFRFTGLDGMIDEGETGELYVAVTAVRNVDSDDEDGVWTVEIPTNGIRAVDEAGLSETYVSGSDNLSETFTVEAAVGGQLDLTEASDSPEAGIVRVSDDNDTTGVKLLAIELEADESDITVEDLPITLTSSGATISEIVKNVRLMDGSKTLKTKSIPSGATSPYTVTFDNIDFDIEEGEVTTLTIVADINELEGNFGEGDSVFATVDGSDNAWDVEDAQGDNVTPDGTVTGEAQAFFIDGLAVTRGSVSATVIPGNAQAGEDDRGQYVIEFRVEAEGGDVYLDKGTTVSDDPDSSIDGVAYATTTGSSDVSTVALFDAASSDNDDTASYFKIDQGDTRTFRLNVTATADSDGYAAIMLTGFKWGTASGSIDRVYTFNLNEFRTGSVYLESR